MCHCVYNKIYLKRFHLLKKIPKTVFMWYLQVKRMWSSQVHVATG